MSDTPTSPITSGPGPVGYPTTAPVKTGMAVTALVLGILGLLMCFPAGIVAIVLGIIALNRASAQPQRYGGRGMAIGGLVCGGTSIILIPFFLLMISILLPSLSRARELSKRLVCQSNMKSVGTSWKIYGSDFAGQGQPTLDDLVAAGYVTPQQLICPSSGLNQSNYVIVRYPPSASPVDNRAVIMYEPKSNHDGEGGNILFADGHTSFVRSDEYDRLMKQLPSRGP